MNFIEDHKSQYLTDTRYGTEEKEAVIVVNAGGFFNVPLYFAIRSIKATGSVLIFL